MATKLERWHIGADGIPKRCTATKRPCPLGSNTEHFDTQAEAALVSERRLFERYGVNYDENYSAEVAELRKLQSHNFLQANQSDHHFLHILNHMQSGRKSSGENYEAYGALAYAQDLGADNIVVFNSNGQPSYISNNELEFMDRESSKNLERAYEAINAQVGREKGKDNYIRSLHFSDDGESMVAHLGEGNGMLDIAVIKDDKVDIVEFKRLFSGGAQISSTSLKVDKNGKPIVNDPTVPSYISEKVKKIGFKETFGTNKLVNLTNRESTEYLIDSYKAHGATKFAYLNRRKEVVEVDLTKDTPSIVRALEEDKVQVRVRLRSNMVSNKPTKDDWERLKTKRTNYFKSGEFPKGDTFTINDLDKSQIRSDGETVNGYVTIGEIVLPIKKSKFKDFSHDEPISLSSIKVRGLTLIGEVKQTG